MIYFCVSFKTNLGAINFDVICSISISHDGQLFCCENLQEFILWVGFYTYTVFKTEQNVFQGGHFTYANLLYLTHASKLVNLVNKSLSSPIILFYPP